MENSFTNRSTATSNEAPMEKSDHENVVSKWREEKRAAMRKWEEEEKHRLRSHMREVERWHEHERKKQFCQHELEMSIQQRKIDHEKATRLTCNGVPWVTCRQTTILHLPVCSPKNLAAERAQREETWRSAREFECETWEKQRKGLLARADYVEDRHYRTQAEKQKQHESLMQQRQKLHESIMEARQEDHIVWGCIWRIPCECDGPSEDHVHAEEDFDDLVQEAAPMNSRPRESEEEGLQVSGDKSLDDSGWSDVGESIKGYCDESRVITNEGATATPEGKWFGSVRQHLFGS